MRSTSRPGGQRNRSFIETTRRAQIVDAAIETIAEVGFTRASLSRIAQRAGISKGVISYHFAGKEELVEEVVAAVYGDIGQHLAKALREPGSAVQALGAHTARFVQYVREHRSSLVALNEVFLNLRGADGEPRYWAHRDIWLHGPLEEVFRSGQRTGELRRFDPRIMAISYRAALEAMVDHWTLHPEWDLDVHAEQIVDLFTRAVRPASPA